MTQPNFGAEIRRLRKAAGLTQKQLAELVGTQNSTISEYEREIHVPSTTRYNAIKEACGQPESQPEPTRPTTDLVNELTRIFREHAQINQPEQ